MGLRDFCNAHPTVRATGMCFSCHRPTCPQCNPRDGCCSEKCFQAKQKWGTERRQPIQRPGKLMALVKFAGALAILYFALKHFGYLPAFLAPK